MLINENSKLYAMAALKNKRATLATEIQGLEEQLAYRRKQLEHVDGCIAVFEPGFDPETIPRKYPKRVKLFRQGELNRLVLDALRNGQGKPLSTHQIAEAIRIAQGHEPSALPALAKRVRGNLQYLMRRETVAKLGKGTQAKWKLADGQLKLAMPS